MTIAMVELAADLWIFGVPVVLTVGAILLALPGFAPRGRYVLVIVGFIAALALPFLEREGHAAALDQVHAGETQGGGMVALQTIAHAIKVPFAAMWLAGSLVLLIRDGIGHLTLRRARSRWQPATEDFKRELKWPEDVTLLLSDDAPLTTGLLRPRVVLPFGIADRRIALHELSHARWRDPLVYAVMRAVAALFWVAPVWPLLRWARREREAAADEMALQGTDASTYVETLLDLSRRAFDHRGLASTMAGGDLEYRARRILMPARSGSLFAAIVVLVSGVMVSSNTSPVDFSSEDEVMVVKRGIRSVSIPTPVRLTRRPKTRQQSLPSSRNLDLVLTPAESPPPPPPAVAMSSPRVDEHRDVDVHRVKPDREVIRIRSVIRN